MGILDIFRRELTQDRFADIVLKRMGQSERFKKTAYDKAFFCIRFQDGRGNSHTFNLHNAYTDYKKAQRGGRTEVLDKYMSMFSASPDELDRETVLKNLMPVIRDRAMFEQAMLMGRLSDGEKTPDITPTTPFFGHLVIALVVDSEHSTLSLSQKKLDELGMDFDAALSVAMDNLRDRTQSNFSTNGNGVFISGWHDVYDASRLLLTDMLYRLPIQGDPVVAIPSRNDLLVTGSRNERGIAELAGLAAHVLENDTRPLAEQLFEFREGAWRLFEGTVPGKERLSKAGYLRCMRTYEDQKQHLARIYEKDEIDIFIASYRVYDNPQLGGLISITQWTRNVVTLLPVSEYLWFYCSIDREVVSVAWDKARQIIELPAAEPSLYPQRFLVREFPSDTQLLALKQAAVSIWKVPEAESTGKDGHA